MVRGVECWLVNQRIDGIDGLKEASDENVGLGFAWKHGGHLGQATCKRPIVVERVLGPDAIDIARFRNGVGDIAK